MNEEHLSRRAAALLALIAITGGAACSGSSSVAGSGDGGSPSGADAAKGADGPQGAPDASVDPSSPAGFCAGYLAVLVDTAVRCNGSSLTAAQEAFGNPIICERFVSSIAAGRTQFDSSGAPACLAAIASATTCDGSTSPSTACDHVITPLVPLGGSCQSYYLLNLSPECTGDAFCKEGPNYACTGVCTARSPLGASCGLFSTDTRCTTNANCDASTKVCTAIPPPVGANGSCGAPGEGACMGGLYCDRSASEGGTAGICHAKKTSGPCTSSTECEPPAHCAGPSAGKTCAAAKLTGESCTAGWGECGSLLYCDQSARCTDVPPAVGQPCGSLGGESVPCGPDAYCNAKPLSGVCVAQAQPGSACTGASLFECAGNGGHCDSMTSTCVACAP